MDECAHIKILNSSFILFYVFLLKSNILLIFFSFRLSAVEDFFFFIIFIFLSFLCIQNHELVPSFTHSLTLQFTLAWGDGKESFSAMYNIWILQSWFLHLLHHSAQCSHFSCISMLCITCKLVHTYTFTACQVNILFYSELLHLLLLFFLFLLINF